MKRKAFLKMTGAGLISAALAPENLLATGRKLNFRTETKLSVQLYTIRDAIKADLEGSINKLAKIGFKYVETAFWPEGTSLKKAATVLKSAGLKVSSCHIELPFGENQKAFTETATAFDCKRLIWHGWPEDKRYSSLAGTKELIKMYNQSSSFAKSMGIEFGLHNHWWEYRNKVDGKSPYEWLIAECDPAIFFELDTYWIKVAGYSPADIIKKFGKRAKYLHIKDGPARWSEKLAEDNPDPMTPVGQGTQDMPAILKAQQAEFLVVEMDKVVGDPFEALRQSYEYLKGKV